MSYASDIGAQLKAAFPGIRVTSTDRTPTQQKALVAAGKTRATNSQHLHGNGIDIVLPDNVSPSTVRAWLGDQGINPGEFIPETGKGPNQGTGAHLHIGLAPKGGAKGGGQSSAAGGTAYDQAQASRQRAEPSEIATIYQAYRNTGKPGGMTPQDAAVFEQAVLDGHVMLPRGASIRAKPSVPVVPKEVVQAYNSHRMDGDEESRAELKRAVDAGEVALPRGMTLQAPGPRSTGELLGMGTRNVMEGAGGLVDTVAGPLNIIANTVTGAGMSTTPFRDLAASGANAMGLAHPESSQELLNSGAIEGGTQGLLTAGVAGLASGAPGMAGTVARGLAAAPVLDTASGAASGYSSETARQAGAGPVGQLAAGLVGGMAPIGLAASAARIRAPKSLPEVVAETPRAAVIDEAGNLTEHGREVAARHNATPEEVAAAYEAPPSVQRGTANDQAPQVVAKEATTGQPVAEIPYTNVLSEAPNPTPEQMGKFGRVENVSLDQTQRKQTRYYWEDFNSGKPNEEAVTGYTDKPVAVRREDGSYVVIDGTHRATLALRKGQKEMPMYVIDAKDYAPAYAGRPKVKPSAAELDDLASELSDFAPAPRAPVEPATPAAPDDMPATALERVQNAEQFNIPLSRGQATKDFGIQVAEQNLRKVEGAPAEEMRRFTQRQADSINTAVEAFKKAIDDRALTTEERGAAVTDAVRELRNQGKAGVTALYTAARDMATKLGDNARGLINLDHGPILSRMREIWSDEGVSDTTRNGLRQLAAEYGMIGTKPVTIEGETAVKLVHPASGETRTITFTGEPKTLDVVTAERFRQRVNDLFKAGEGNPQESLKPLIDNEVEAAVERAANHEGAGDVGAAFKQAREAHKTQKATFAAKDVVQAIADWKKGTRTDNLRPDQVLQRALANPSDLKRVKAVLLSNKTPKSEAAWRAIQAHGLAQVFEKATQQNANLSGDVGQVISGAKLRTAINDFGGRGQGVEMLKTLLDPEQFNALMAMRRAIEDATIPISGTVPVGSAPWWQRLITSTDNKFSAAMSAAGFSIGGPAGAAVGSVAGKAVGKAVGESLAAKETAATLKSATEYTAEQAAKDTAQGTAPKPSAASKAGQAVKGAASASIKAFIDTYASPRVLAPILAAGEANHDR